MRAMAEPFSRGIAKEKRGGVARPLGPSQAILDIPNVGFGFWLFDMKPDTPPVSIACRVLAFSAACRL